MNYKCFLAIRQYSNIGKEKKNEMTWFQDNNCHILESKRNMHRLLYCPLCQKLISKTQCQKLRQDKHGKLYKVKTYHYDKLSNIERAKKRKQKQYNRMRELPNIELSKIVNHIFNNNS